MRALVGIVIGSLVGYGFVFWTVWVVFGWFSTEAVQTQNLGYISVAAAVLCAGAINAFVIGTISSDLLPLVRSRFQKED